MAKLLEKKKSEILFVTGIIFLIISMIGKVMDVHSETISSIDYETIDTKNISAPKVAEKRVEVDNSIINQVIHLLSNSDTEQPLGPLEEVALPSKKEKEEKEQSQQTEEAAAQPEVTVPEIVWRLPTERGRVTQNPSYGHVAYDITSPRGSYETIYPISDGYISGIYRDNAGALIVTVLHIFNGKKYTSQYVHLSSYDPGIYVGKRVDTNTPLGKMGTTGYSTGVHLHIALLDCALFDKNDPYCKDLNDFFQYGRIRFQQGYIGLGSVINMPAVWNTR